jgi:hypothetical protein
LSKPQKPDAEISVLEITQSDIEFCVLGTSPLIFNRMSEKAKRELLLPKGRKTKADRSQSLKHEPVEEFRASVYRRIDDGGPTRLVFPSTAFKGAMAAAALDLPGARKSEIGRLVYVVGDKVDIYGVPKLLMSVVRSADPNKTPDIRTRAIVAEWACRVRVRFVMPRLREQTVANLLAASGVTVGVGDFRQEKGKGSYGQFSLVGAEDADFARIVAAGGREAQDDGLARPEPYDLETEELLSWFGAEIVQLTGKKAAA